QSRAANLNRHFESALASELRRVEAEVADAEREGFRRDAERVRSFVAGYQPRAKTLVVFADGSPEPVWSGELQMPLATDARWRPRPWVRPLIEAMAEHERYGIALVDKQRARLFVASLGEIEERGEAIASGEVRHKKASGTDHMRSDMHFQRQDDLHVRWHVKHVADMLDDLVRASGIERIALAGPVDATTELGEVLPQHLADRVAGTLRMAIDAPPSEVLSRTLELAEEAERQLEAARLTQLFDGGCVGLDATLEALQQGRVMGLLYAEAFTARGRECPRCRALSAAAAAAACTYCGEQTAVVDDLVERAIERT